MSNGRLEKLKVVLAIQAQPDAEEFQIGSAALGKFAQVSGVADVQALQTVVSLMSQFGMAMEFKENGTGKVISTEAYLEQVKAQGKWSRPVEAGGLSFRFGRVPLLKQSFVSIEQVRAGSTVPWLGWVQPFMTEEGFVQAWVSDVEYNHWQNAKDPLQYDAVGRNYSQLPTKSNGLPPPLGQVEIDISSNPGREVLQSGYVEAIGSVMWLGNPFWTCVGVHRKSSVLEADWLNVRQLPNDVIQIRASEECFHDKESADVQNSLRAILYGQPSA